MFSVNGHFEQKANQYKKPLIHTKVCPERTVEFANDTKGFQGLGVRTTGDFQMPYTLGSGDSIILDFGRHCVGYLHFVLKHIEHITDSPVMLRFSFGEFPYEIMAEQESYKGVLGSGWIQREEKNIVLTPYDGCLERRYAFRYLKIERLDKSDYPFDINIADIYADCVSAVTADMARTFDIPDPVLERIYDMSVTTLAECSQDVYEDGPKRDRRLWIGDLRLEALTDYAVYGNIELIKRCIYLFASYKAPHKHIASCLFPDSQPYVDEWYFADYSMFFISCIYDYTVNTGNRDLASELYDEMYSQYVLALEDMKTGYGNGFFDWCPDLDKEVCLYGMYIYTFRQLAELTSLLGRDTSDIDDSIAVLKDKLMKFYDGDKGLFVTTSGQISFHSQVWAVLSGVLEKNMCHELLDRIDETDFDYYCHTPYMMHYYVEALFDNGRKEQAMELIKGFWGDIAELGFDCCPEIFNPADHFESPYNAPEINSACHAWSCSPAYWIYRYYNH